ncbi:MAG: heavy-metal-associated domain-containing protein [Bacteroidales bacterium]|nr:heavy-metal-associated domain-containing protein [Bacteroidales bacterium]
MPTMKFKTNIRCSGCKAKVAAILNQESGITYWDVDLNDPERILIVEADSIADEQIIELVKKAGYTATKF